MISLLLIAAHMFGDYVLQNDWIAGLKLVDWRVRTLHVALYTLPFLGVAAWAAPEWWHAPKGLAWLAAVAVPHWLVDCRRFRTRSPWANMPWMFDQSLHAVCLAVAGAYFFGPR